MMATVHPATSSLVPLLESLEDTAAGQVEQTDAYLTIANRLSGEDGKHFLLAVVKHFTRLGKLFQAHIVSPNVELSQAALQALGFCVFHSTIVSGIPANFVEEILVALNSLVVKSTDKNTCTRALWVISKQNFPSDAVVRKVPDILKTLEAVRAREDLQSVIMDHEALNVVIRLLEQTPGPMGEGAVQWARLVIPLVVHSASKVRLRAAAALEMGMPLLLQKQQEVAAIIEPLMSSKLIPELQKLFSSKNESNVLKLWPLFVRLLGKLLHRGGPFINSLLHLEELGFRSSSPIIKKIAFIAWKSLIDNFALNPEILCSAKRLKLLMQPLSSIQVRTEALLLTKLEVWWYLVVRLGPNLAVNFEQVGVPLLQIAVSTDSPLLSVNTPSRNSSQNTSLGPTTPKAGGLSFSSSSSTPRLGLNSSVSAQPAFGSIQLLGLEMLLHYLQGSEVNAAAAKSKLQLSLEPLTHPLLTSPSSFTKHAGVLISAVRDSFISIGKDAPEALLTLIWKSLIGFVTAAIETAGSKKDRPGSEVLTLLLQALESIVSSEALPAQRSMGLLEATVKGIPRKTLGSAAYQVANMDVLNGTPALFLILLFHRSSVLPAFVTDERFFLCLETLIGCGLSGPASPLAFSESVLGVMSRNAEAIENKEYLWRMWSVMINPLTDTITQTNEVNQGDALEHNFTAVHHALMFPVTHLLAGHALPQMTQKSLLGTWSRLYKAFARCSALVATAEENVCCEELCGKMAAVLDAKVLSSPSTLEALASILLIIIECVDFSPYTPQYQKTKSPHTPLGWVRKKNKALGNLTTFQSLLVQVLESFLSQDTPPEMLGEGTGSPSGGPGTVLIAILSALFSNLVLGTAVQGALSALSVPLALLYEQAGRPQNEQPKFFTSLGPKLEKLLGEILGCLQTRSSLAFDDELLVLLAPLLRVVFPHRSKQLRTLVTQFWNATFANAPILTYPEDLKPILSQVKQTTPIILPGFQAVDVPEDYSGQYSSECSQLETHVSGVKIASVGKRDSLLSRAGESKEKGSKAPSKPISVKLDFGSPKLPRRELLEEDASMDFVFIPPETKERVLTEHQKEVKRTKRVDIPAMYNNLDASQDTTAFTQYTQSQEDSVDKLPANEEAAETMKDEGQPEVQDEKMETEEAPEPDKGPIQAEIDVDSVAGEGAGKEKRPVTPEKVEPKCDDGPPEQGDVPAEETNVETAESSGDDCNISASSDVVSGTPQKPNSRRQSFITLEKYVEGKAASPIRVTTFTGPLSRASSSQDASHSQEKDSESRGTSEASAGMEAEQELGPHGNSSEEQVSSQLEEALTNENEEQQPHPEVEEVGKPRCSDGTEDEDDIIPDTQIEVDSAETGKQEGKTPVEDTILTNDEDSCAELTDDNLEDSYLNDSQCSQVSPSQAEIRRSGRRRSRPLRPGEDRDEVEGRYKQMRKTSPGKGLTQSDSLKPDLSPASQIESQSHGRPGLRSKMPIEAQEVEGKERLGKTRADSQAASSQMAQNDSQSLGRVTRSKVAGPTDEEMSKTKSQMTLSTPASQTDSQSQGRSSRRSKVGGSAEEMNQRDSQMALSKPVSQVYSQSQERPSRRTRASGLSEEMSQTDTETRLSTPFSQTDDQSQGRPGRRRSKASGLTEEIRQTDAQTSLSTPVSQTDAQSQDIPTRRSQASAPTEEVSETHAKTSLSTSLSQMDGQSQDISSQMSQASAPTEEVSETHAKTSLSTSLSQMDGQSQDISSQMSQASVPTEEISQTDAQTSLSTPVSEIDGQSQDIPSTRSQATLPTEEMSQTDAQTSLSTPVSQIRQKQKASSPTEEMSQTDAQTSLSTPVSEIDGQSQDIPSTRSQASFPTERMSQTDVQTSLSTPVSQTDTQSRGRPGRRSKASGLTDEMSQNDAQTSLSTPVSQTDGQSQGRLTRRSMASALSEEMSQTDTQTSLSTSVSQTDSQSRGKPGRRSKASGLAEEPSQTDTQTSLSTPVSQTDTQSRGKPGRRSKASGLTEEPSQTDTQTSLSTPVSQTDTQSRGKPGRRSKASGLTDEMSQNDAQTSLSTPVSQTDGQSQGRLTRRSMASGLSEEMSQTDTQTSLSTPVSQTGSQSRGRPGRRSKTSGGSEEPSQTDTQTSLTTPVSQSNSQSRGRPGRRSKASGLTEEPSQTDTQTSLSAPVSQTDSPSRGRPGRRSKASGLAEEMSQSDAQARLSTPVTRAESQSLGRASRSKVAGPSEEMSQTDSQTGLSAPLRQNDNQLQGSLTRNSKATDPTEEVSQTDLHPALSTPASQTDSQSQGKPSKRSKIAELNVSDSLCSPSDIQSEHSQLADKGEGTQESSQVLDSYKTRGFSQGLLSGIENSESDVSETCEDGLVKKTWKRGRKRKLLDSEAKPTSPLKTQQVPEGSEQMEAMETSPEVPMDNSESKSILVITEAEAVEPSEEKENKNLTKTMLPDGSVNPTVESRAELKSASEAFGNVTPEMREEISKPFLDPSSEIVNLTVNRQKVQTKRGRGRRRSRGYNRRAADVRETLSQEILSQESDISDSQDLGETIVSPDPKERPLSDSKMMCPQPENALAQQEDDAGMNDDVFLEANTTSTPTVSERFLTATPSETVEKTWNTMTTEGTWNTCDSELQSGIEVSDLTGDMEEGQQQGIEVPQGTDVTASTLDPAKEQGREENSVVQVQGINVEEFASVQEKDVASVQGKDFASVQGKDFASVQGKDFASVQGIDFASVQGIDFASVQGKAFASVQEKDFASVQEKDFASVPEKDFASVPEKDFASVPEKDFASVREKDFASVQGKDFASVQEKDFASVQDQNATKEVVLAAVEEEGKVEDTQIDTDMLIAAPADTIAVQALPDEPPAPQHVTAEPLCLDSPPKQKHLDSVAGEPEVGQSPSSGKMKGVWSPSASPSTSILKKGQKRPLEVESPSPLQKSRRVSFADPIHHQELADDIDRRSPVIRSSGGSSPRSKNVSAISSQQKFITTPTKSLLSLSPRNLRSPGYKSSKKCLISEMSQEPKAIPRDCVYPALVSCSTPVEAVLPQISSNMWPRGFGQLVRARNIRTVGDLSALTPTEIKSLPIRSPKLSNVKKALRNYHEQQRKGRSDDLKGFDEMEKMTSEPEETELAVHQEEGKPTVEQVTVAPPCSISAADGCRVSSDAESSDVPAPPPAEQRPTELPSAVEALGARLTPEEMGQCSPGQLVLMHEQLGGMMRSIVVQLQARLAPSPGESIP